MVSKEAEQQQKGLECELIKELHRQTLLSGNGRIR